MLNLRWEAQEEFPQVDIRPRVSGTNAAAGLQLGVGIHRGLRAPEEAELRALPPLPGSGGLGAIPSRQSPRIDPARHWAHRTSPAVRGRRPSWDEGGDERA